MCEKVRCGQGFNNKKYLSVQISKVKNITETDDSRNPVLVENIYKVITLEIRKKFIRVTTIVVDHVSRLDHLSEKLEIKVLQKIIFRKRFKCEV